MSIQEGEHRVSRVQPRVVIQHIGLTHPSVEPYQSVENSLLVGKSRRGPAQLRNQKKEESMFFSQI